MKAMLAYNRVPKIEEITFPKLVSYKLDGIRCLMINGKAMSRNNKPIPNVYVQQVLGNLNLHGLDGELMLREGDFNDAQSAFMSRHGKPDFYFAVFDSFLKPSNNFTARLAEALYIVREVNDPRVVYVQHALIVNADSLTQYYQNALNASWEGLILRDPNGPYKLGRSTLKQQWMLKLKPEEDAEGTIIGFEELQHNLDTSTKKLENLVGGGMLGAFIVQYKNTAVKVGTGKGLTHALRQYYWDNQDSYLGRRLTFSYQELSKYGVPRFPRFKGIRED